MCWSSQPSPPHPPPCLSLSPNSGSPSEGINCTLHQARNSRSLQASSSAQMWKCNIITHNFTSQAPSQAPWFVIFYFRNSAKELHWLILPPQTESSCNPRAWGRDLLTSLVEGGSINSDMGTALSLPTEWLNLFPNGHDALLIKALKCL